MYKDIGEWELIENFSGFPVKRSDEAEPSRYRSIRFGQDWGEFIEGEPFVERDHRADSERLRAGLRASQQMIMNRRR